MKKKFGGVLLALICAMSLVAFAACGGGDPNSNNGTDDKTYTVTYSLGSCGETEYAGTTALPPSATANGENGHTVTLPAPPVWTGYAFGGWYDREEKAGEGGASYTAAGDVLLTAHWTAVSYTLQFNVNKPADATAEVEGDAGDLSVTLQSPSKTLPTLSLDGYVFDGWKRDNAGESVQSFTLTAALIEGLGDAAAFRFTAQWTAVPPNQYAITFTAGADDGTVNDLPANTSAEAGAYAIPEKEPTRTGYTFQGWKVEGDSKIYKKDGDNKTYNVTDKAVTFTAQWEKNKYTVSYSYGDGTDMQDKTEKVEWGTKVTLTEPAPKEGYRFGGWNVTKAEGTVTVTESSFTMPMEDVTVTAQWTRVYGVTYSDGVESETIDVPADPKQYAVGESVKIEGNDPSRQDYDFAGWQVNGNEENVKHKGDTVPMTEGGLTFTAKWTPVAPTCYEIKFYDYDGHTELSTVQAEDGKPIVYDKANPTREADVQYTYEFAGWSSTPGGAVEALPNATGTASFYAVYTATLRSYEITFMNGEDTVETVTVKYGEHPECTQTVADKTITEMLVGKHSGWAKDGETYTDALPEVTGEATYTAVFETALKEGAGTAETPYSVTAKADLEFLAKQTADDFAGKYFELKNEIEAGELASIGTAQTPFAGIFDGGEYKITYTQEEGAGLFGSLTGTVKNLKVEATVHGATVGGVVGTNGGTVENCTATGKVYGTAAAGGIVGDNTGTVNFGSSSALVYLNGKLEMSAMAGTEEKAAGVLVGKGGTVKLADEVWDGEAVSEKLNGDGGEETPYVIASGADLAHIRDNCASSSYFAGKYFILSADIDLGGHDWAGIGGTSSSSLPKGFQGILDGKNHAIYHINVNASSDQAGLFRSLTGGSISNLVLEGTVTSTASQYAGLLAGYSNTPIENVTVYGKITANSAIYVAGLVGYQAKASIMGCTIYGEISAKDSVGGITGRMNKQTTIGDIENCVNYATISVGTIAHATSSGVGGIVGVMGSDATKGVVNCENYGEIIGTANTKGGLGGIVGQLFSSTVDGCKNFGTVTGGEYVGGVVGYVVVGGKVQNCVGEADSSVSGTRYIGGVIGGTPADEATENASVIAGNRFKGTVTGANNVGGIIGFNTATISDCNAEECAKVSGGFAVGGIVGYHTKGNKMTKGNTVTECDNDATVSCIEGGAGYWIGGIAGVNGASCTVTQCENRGAVISEGEGGNAVNQHGVGGIAGYNANVITGCNTVAGATVSGKLAVGGIAGYNTGKASVTECDNYAEVFCTEGGAGYWIGGIVGMNGAGCTVTSCDNHGAVISAEKDGNTVNNHGVGGIVGSNYGEGSVVGTCFNYGTVSGKQFLGGIVGKNNNAGAEVKNCENHGNLVCSLTEGDAYVGGLVGYNLGKVTKNTNYGTYEAAEGLQKIDYLVGYSEASDDLVYENTDLHGQETAE